MRHALLPITEHFTKKSGRLTNPLQFVVPRYRRDIGRTSLKYRGAVLWNTVDTNLKKYSNLNTFKNKIKQFKSSINQLSFRKTPCMITKESHDYCYFLKSYFYPLARIGFNLGINLIGLVIFHHICVTLFGCIILY